MSQFEKLWFGTWGLIVIASIIYWGNLAWFHPDRLKKRLLDDAQRHPDWLFIKGYSLKFTERYGILMLRFTTLLVAFKVDKSL